MSSKLQKWLDQINIVNQSKICAKARIEQFTDDFYAGQNYFANSVSIGLTQSKIIKSKTHLTFISTETEDNYNFVEM